MSDLEVVSAVARVFDVPPWVMGDYRKPRFSKIRWPSVGCGP